MDDESGFGHCVDIRAVRDAGVVLLNGVKSRAEFDISGISVRYDGTMNTNRRLCT